MLKFVDRGRDVGDLESLTEAIQKSGPLTLARRDIAQLASSLVTDGLPCVWLGKAERELRSHG